MTREKLSNRRQCETLDFDHAGNRFSLTVGRYRDGRPAETFLSSRHNGSGIEAIARDCIPGRS
jgi:hypothetical protein